MKIQGDNDYLLNAVILFYIGYYRREIFDKPMLMSKLSQE